uniref:MATalpha1 n=1 Tax=Stenocarpella maydis TaxID=238245 RepID=A0A1B1UZH0_9PEZI|nr:MATalpha1 [Stenocarpella maydis]
MHVATKQILGGRANVQAIIDEQRRVKDGRVEKPLATNKIVKAQDQPAKKGVNGYMMFRSAMQALFETYSQRQRSEFIREMWAKEPHKTTWALIAKVWTFIRDNSGGYDNILQYTAGAIEETRLTPPDRWFRAYNFWLVRDNMGTITARQRSAPTSLPAPRELTDVELMFRVLKRGLPVKDPVQLLDQLARSQKHYIAFCRHDPTAPNGKLETNFFNAMDDPLTAVPFIMGLSPTDSTFAGGITHMDNFDGFHFDEDLVAMPNQHTVNGYGFDNITAHLSVPNNGALDPNPVLENPQSLEMGAPPQWDDIGGQISQQGHLSATESTAHMTEPYLSNDDLEVHDPYWDLQATL